MKDLECPYCKHEFNDDGDMEGYNQDSNHEFECPACEKIFMATISWSVDYSPFKTPCKNDNGKCEYIKQNRYPIVRFGKTVGVRCKWCEDRMEVPIDNAGAYGFTDEEIKKDMEYFK